MSEQRRTSAVSKKRRDGVLLVLGVWALTGWLLLLFVWPLVFGVLTLIALFVVPLYLAIFVWPHMEEW